MMNAPALPKIPIVVIDEAQKDRYLDAGYNPAVFTDAYTQHDYIEEWYRVFDEVKASVGAQWQHGIGDDDFFMDSDWVPVRFLCIEVTTQHMLQPRLLGIVHNALSHFDVDYAVDICNDWVFFKLPDHPDGNIGEYFHIFVEKKQILAYSKSFDLLERLGICTQLGGDTKQP